VPINNYGDLSKKLTNKHTCINTNGNEAKAMVSYLVIFHVKRSAAIILHIMVVISVINAC